MYGRSKDETFESFVTAIMCNCTYCCIWQCFSGQRRREGGLGGGSVKTNIPPSFASCVPFVLLAWFLVGFTLYALFRFFL